jgi:hypothetical protein
MYTLSPRRMHLAGIYFYQANVINLGYGELVRYSLGRARHMPRFEMRII